MFARLQITKIKRHTLKNSFFIHNFDFLPKLRLLRLKFLQFLKNVIPCWNLDLKGIIGAKIKIHSLCGRHCVDKTLLDF